jgi:NADP-dependent 3-hydroxy acid dehydrogenase YdfG
VTVGHTGVLRHEQFHSQLERYKAAVKNVVRHLGEIDILVNNAGLALGAPKRFPDLGVADIVTMTNTNV